MPRVRCETFAIRIAGNVALFESDIFVFVLKTKRCFFVVGKCRSNWRQVP
jgi:hypothetical protein